MTCDTKKITNISIKLLIMSDTRDDAQASRLSSHSWHSTSSPRLLLVETLFSPPSDPTATDENTPDAEFSEYANRQSVKINAGLDLCRPTEIDSGDGTIESPVAHQHLANGTLVVDVNFSALEVPAGPYLPAHPATNHLVHILLSPPSHAFLHGVLSIQWVIGALGQHHFKFQTSNERYVLRPDSEMRTQGSRLGLPGAYFEWLCGDEEEASLTEQSMLLTQEYFEGIERDVSK